MKLTRNIAVALSALAFGAVPAVAVASGSGHGKSNAPGQTKSNSSTSTKAIGEACLDAGATKQHVKGERGTEFSRCVVAAAQLDKHPSMSASAACKGDSTKHVSGHKGTPFSECVVQAAKARSTK